MLFKGRTTECSDMFSVCMREVSDGIQVGELWDVVPLGEKCFWKPKVHRGTEKNTTEEMEASGSYSHSSY